MTTTPKTGDAGRREGAITLPTLRAFVAVSEAGSVSAAAERLGLSQPTISVQLAALEQACGMPLMHRKPRIALTPAGEELFVRARLILSRVSEFEGSVRDLRDLQRGRISIGLSTPHFALPLIARLCAAYPAIESSVALGNTATLLDEIQRCRIDVGIMTLEETPPPFVSALIAAPRLAICVRRDDPLAERTTVSVSDLVDRSFILREKGSMTLKVLRRAFAAEGQVLQGRFELGAREAIKEAVAAGLGIGAMFEAELGDDPRLRLLPLDGVPTTTGVYAVALRESLDIPAVRALFELAASG